MLLGAASALSAQDPSHTWRSIQTQHFFVHYSPGLEPLARRVAANAERAYGQLAATLHPPRGMVDIVLSDDVDLSNGSATPAPTNRINIYAAPPIGETALRYTTDWTQLVVTHELTHIFHLDRSRGVWSLAQKVFGRSPFLFPNLYSPSWLAEGLAVYYETKLAGEGRLEGPEHYLIAQAAAIDHRIPRLGNVTLATPQYPFGEATYAYGSLFIDYLARTRGEDRIRKFIDAQAADLIPYIVDLPAHSAFGTTFTSAFGEWRDSMTKQFRTLEPAAPLTAWHDLTRDGVFVSFPRWFGDSSIVYSGTPGRDSYGAFAVGLDGKRHRIGRRNSRSPNIPLAGGGILFSQIELTSPYAERSDLFVQRGRHQVRLTRNARLTTPDARADGEIVAVEMLPGGSRLVRVSRDGKSIRPITSGGFDEQWTEPRWSFAGDRIAVVRWLRGGTAQVVVVDTLGAVKHVSTSGRVVASTPAWLPADAGLMYALGTDRTNEIVVDRFDAGSAATTVNGLPHYPNRTFALTRGTAGVFDPQPSPDGKSTAAVRLRSDGYHLGVGECCASETPRDVPLDTGADPRTPALAIDSTPSKAYSAWRTFYPRYWIPTIETGFYSNSYRIGGTAYGHDVINRHAVAATLLIPTDNTGLVASASYSYRGFGLPVIDVGVVQDWAGIGNVVDTDASHTKLGEVHRRIRDAAATASWTRQRVRTALTLSGGVGAEQRSYVSVPDGLLPRTNDPSLYNTATFPRLTATASFAKYLQPPFAISPEDGFTTTLSLRERLKSGVKGNGDPSFSGVASVTAYKSIDLPGFAHHVIAFRGAGGYADTRSNGYFEIGGTSGSSFEIVPGYFVGEGRRTFGVRGFNPGTVVGIRALGASMEYRVPLLRNAFTAEYLPLFAEKTSLSLWGDYAMAWCPDAAPRRQVCTDINLVRRTDIASVGAELNLLAGVLAWDVPYRFRLGIAYPVHNGRGARVGAQTLYLTSGISY